MMAPLNSIVSDPAWAVEGSLPIAVPTKVIVACSALRHVVGLGHR